MEPGYKGEVWEKEGKCDAFCNVLPGNPVARHVFRSQFEMLNLNNMTGSAAMVSS